MSEATRETLCLIWLTQAVGIGTALRIYGLFGSGEAAYAAGRETYLRIDGLSSPQLEQLCHKALEPAQKVVDGCRRKGIRILTQSDEDYPEQLRVIDAPPLVLYLLGTLPDPDTSFLISFAGSRKANDYGLDCAYQLGNELAQARLMVVSGVAGGCDLRALQGAMHAGGSIGLVLAGGVDQLYRTTDTYRRLYRYAADHGFLLSETPPGTHHIGELFRTRNRLLTGIADAVVCVQCGIASGTMQVASLAVDQGKDIFAVPSLMQDPAGAGTNQLIRDGGATLLTGSMDLVRLAYAKFTANLRRDRAQQEQAVEEAGSTEAEPLDSTEPLDNTETSE